MCVDFVNAMLNTYLSASCFEFLFSLGNYRGAVTQIKRVILLCFYGIRATARHVNDICK